MSLRVLVADDQDIVRTGLAMILGAQDDIEVVATAVDGRQLQTWVETASDRNLTPAQVDLAWQTVVTAIGRPDPLA